MENIHINLTAIIVAVIANFVLGFIWYTPLFGKRWAKEQGMDPNGPRPPASVFIRGMSFMIIGNFLMAWVLAHNIAAWGIVQQQPTATPMEMSPMANVLSATGFTWIGFFLPVDLTRVAWERKSWTLFFIDTVYHLLSLFVVSAIIIYMK